MADNPQESPETPPPPSTWSMVEQDWITSLAAGHSYSEIAERTGADRKTVSKFAKRADVCEAVEGIRAERWERATNLATNYHSRAIEVTNGLLGSDDENIKLNAARLMHRMNCDLQELNLAKRLEEVEKEIEKLKGE